METAPSVDLAAIRERVTKLIALALNNPSETEAAAAALKACALIREHQLLDPPAVATTPHVPEPDFVDFMRRQQQAQQNAYGDIFGWANSQFKKSAP